MADSMKSLFKRKLYTTYILSSPWLLAAAVALIVFIIATFASHNYRLEKRLMREALEQRAVTLVRVLYSSIRVTLINEIRQHQQLSSAWPEQLQQVVSHVSDENDILFISLADVNGTVVAHSDQKKIGSRLQLEGSDSNVHDTPIHYRIVTSEEYGHAFIASTAFTMLSQERGGRRMPRMGRNGQMMHRQQGFEHRGPMMGFAIPPEIGSQQFRVAVGLDVRGYEQALVHLQWQILLLSVAMLLVGVGGWLSLAAVQGYRVSRETVEKVQAYTALLVAQLPLGVIATTPGGRIETWNGATTALTGRSAKEAVGKLPGEVLPEVLAAFFEESETEEESRPKLVEAAQRLVLTLAGERRVLLCQPLKITDAVQSYRGRVLLLSDISELTDLELRMRENERLAAIGRMAGGVAHEVRNP
ncbi:MAG: PAS domain-containing protein, partial [Desulfobulbaceae bacterium]|nr:PAS domain-containing protein [Desulfobulbaceae bacterium]